MDKEKYKKYQLEYRIRNKQKLLKYFKKRYQEKKEILLKKFKQYRKNNKQKIKEQKHQEYLRHKQVYLDRAKKQTENNKEKIKKIKKEYYQKNKKILIEKARIRNKQRRKVNLNYRLIQYLRSRLWWALKNNTKFEPTLLLLGCSIDFLKKHLESKFTPGMSWNNYGKWHIDHKRPCAKFDLSKPEEQRRCFNYKNLQPLWAKDNLEKSDKLI